MDVYREYVLIGSGELQPGTTLEAFVQNVIGQAKQQATDATSVETDTVLSGLPAKQVILTGRIGPMSLRSLNIFAMSGNRLYHVLYSAEASKFDKFFGGAQTIINSLKVY